MNDFCVGEKRKVPVVESITQQEQKGMSMKDWLDYFNTPAPDRQAIVRPFLQPILSFIKYICNRFIVYMYVVDSYCCS